MSDKPIEEIKAEIKALFEHDREEAISFGQAWLKALLTPTQGDERSATL